MKNSFALIVIFAVAGVASADFTYVYGPGESFGAKTLFGSDSILVAGGWGMSLTLGNSAYGRIESTTPLGAYLGAGIWEGGIWGLDAGASSTLEVFGGEIDDLDVWNSARLWLYAGRVNTLQSAQTGSPHIDLFCKAGYSFNAGTGMLTGTWGNDSAFSIKLVNMSGYTPTIDNINFIIVPEPASVILLGLGGVIWAARRRRLA